MGLHKAFEGTEAPSTSWRPPFIPAFAFFSVDSDCPDGVQLLPIPFHMLGLVDRVSLWPLLLPYLPASTSSFCSLLPAVQDHHRLLF